MELSDLPVERDIATTWRMYAPPSPLPKPPLRPALAVSAEPLLRVRRWICVARTLEVFMTVVAVVAQSFVVSSFGGDDAPSDAGSDPQHPSYAPDPCR